MFDDEFDEVPVFAAGKRTGLQHTSWMGDWFVSWSPRNGNSNAEGPWDQWVDFALKVLSHPATKVVRPDAYIEEPVIGDFYDSAGRYLTEEEIAALFPKED
jgi:hypothetical protein